MAIDLSGIAPSGDALLVVPPFAGMDRPSYGLHLLQGLAARAGYRCTVLYANILFARVIGEARYSEICYSATGDLNGEKVFAPAAFGGPARDREAGEPQIQTFMPWRRNGPARWRRPSPVSTIPLSAAI